MKQTNSKAFIVLMCLLVQNNNDRDIVRVAPPQPTLGNSRPVQNSGPVISMRNSLLMRDSPFKGKRPCILFSSSISATVTLNIMLKRVSAPRVH